MIMNDQIKAILEGLYNGLYSVSEAATLTKGDKS